MAVATFTNVPLDFPCPKCKQPPGLRCVGDILAQTPRHAAAGTNDIHAARFRAMERHNRGMTKRGYSREFKPHGDTGKRYLLDSIPAGLWADVKAKCKRDGISVRALILKLLTTWVHR